MITPLIIANWKMAIDRDGVKAFKAGWSLKPPMESVEAVIAPPAPYLSLVQELTHVSLCAQNVSENDMGAHTGEISAEMLTDLGCQYVIVGHSERRQNQGETNAIVAQKAKRAQMAGLTPVVCVGEPSQIRASGDAVAYVTQQALTSCEGLSADLVIAYEPIWAIGSGEAASANVASAMHLEIKAALTDQYPELRVIYGGSVKPENCAAFTMAEGIDGLLVGGASLSAESFWNICASAKGAG
ncbi:MAG: triose-phosphate isomerase [Luminiphilus sp.]|jgi:triosephosphate isomerase|nr:triose-phosphate isomerase [Luminiphilus sp.]